MKSENSNGRYPSMQNPGDTRLPEGVNFTPRKHVLILGGAALINPNGYDEKVALFPKGNPSESDEAQALAETTYRR